MLGSPALWVSRWNTVMRSRSPPQNSGITFASGVVSVSKPRSIAWNTSTLVNALVTENRLNTESTRHRALARLAAVAEGLADRPARRRAAR